HQFPHIGEIFIGDEDMADLSRHRFPGAEPDIHEVPPDHVALHVVAVMRRRKEIKIGCNREGEADHRPYPDKAQRLWHLHAGPSFLGFPIAQSEMKPRTITILQSGRSASPLTS